MVISPLAETKFISCCGRSQQNEPWNLLYLSRLVDSVILIYVNPQTFSKISFSQSLAETSIEKKYGPYSVSSLVVPKMEDEFSGTDAGKNSK